MYCSEVPQHQVTWPALYNQGGYVFAGQAKYALDTGFILEGSPQCPRKSLLMKMTTWNKPDGTVFTR